MIKKTVVGIVLLMALIAIGSAVTYLSEDIVGDGRFWMSSDHLSVMDRAGGNGSWSYGHIVAPGLLTSMFSFDGDGGWYTEGSFDGNQSQWIRASDLSTLNASSQLTSNESSIQISGSGQAQGWVKNYGQNGHSTDGSRVYLSGTFEINRNTRAW